MTNYKTGWGHQQLSATEFRHPYKDTDDLIKIQHSATAGASENVSLHNFVTNSDYQVPASRKLIIIKADVFTDTNSLGKLHYFTTKNASGGTPFIALGRGPDIHAKTFVQEIPALNYITAVITGATTYDIQLTGIETDE